MANTVVNQTNTNLLTKEQYDALTPSDDELYATNIDTDSEFKTKIMTFNAPDWNAGVSISTLPYIVPTNGFIHMRYYTTNNTAGVLINGIDWSFVTASSASLRNAYVIPVSQGDVISPYYNYQPGSIYFVTFFPCKGVQNA